jgi:hypothetical protein
MLVLYLLLRYNVGISRLMIRAILKNLNSTRRCGMAFGEPLCVASAVKGTLAEMFAALASCTSEQGLGIPDVLHLALQPF